MGGRPVTYSAKEVFLTVQGEGGQAGRPAVFLRFAGCNLWSGREQDRATAQCRFCDTDFVGTDGQGGGKFADAEALAELGRAAIGAIGPEAYTEEQVEAWLSNFAGPEVYQAQADSGTQIFIATDDDDGARGEVLEGGDGRLGECEGPGEQHRGRQPGTVGL